MMITRRLLRTSATSSIRWKSSTSSSKSSSSSSISPLVAIVGGAALTSILAFWGSGGRAGKPYAFCGDRAVSLLRLLDPETAHKITVTALKYGFGPINESTKTDVLSVRLWGKTFRNCVGMAAGFDKQGEVMDPLLRLGFGFVEIGGVTPLPQDGNPKPRMFRLPEDRALINRFGLNSEGADVVSKRVELWRERKPQNGIVGVNMAKTTGSSSALKDYCTGAKLFGANADFVVLNFSCPNVKWTKNLGKGGSGGEESIRNIIRAVQEELKKIENEGREPASLLIKLGPDMTMKEKEEMANVALETGVHGLIVSNTSSRRPSDLKCSSKTERGGLSGRPIREMANQTLRDVYVVFEREDFDYPTLSHVFTRMYYLYHKKITRKATC